MNDEEWKAARERFCKLARLRSQSHEHNFSLADRFELQRFDALVDEWHREGVVKDILLPLLESDEKTIRYAAAIFLVRRGMQDAALKVLDEIEIESPENRAENSAIESN